MFFVQSTSNRLKDDIAECAIALFRDRGYDNVSVNEICESAHTSRSVFYSVFKGKRAILDYVVSKPQQNDEESFRKFADAENDFERIWQLFDRFIDIALDFGPKLTSRLFIMQFDSPRAYATRCMRWMIFSPRSRKTAQKTALSKPRSRRSFCRA